ncbi:hypothetical protein EsH8_VIII_000966 [Colletotrichum jinshuiense]
MARHCYHNIAKGEKKKKALTYIQHSPYSRSVFTSIMPNAKSCRTERPPAPANDPIPAGNEPSASADPFRLDMSQGMLRKALPPFNARRALRPRPSAEILADLDCIDKGPEHVASRPATPALLRRPHTPINRPPSSPGENDDFKTPPSNRTVTRLRVVELETSPASSGSKRSVDTEGDARMQNGTWTSPEAARFHQREEIRAMVMQSVHDNFEFERSRFADEIRGQLLATIGEDVKWLVHQRFDATLAAVVGESEESEVAMVQLVRDRLRRMSDEARVRVFCTEEMLEVLKRLVSIVDLEIRTEAWNMVEDDDLWT